jgi:hypothetical protein
MILITVKIDIVRVIDKITRSLSVEIDVENLKVMDFSPLPLPSTKGATFTFFPTSHLHTKFENNLSSLCCFVFI